MTPNFRRFPAILCAALIFAGTGQEAWADDLYLAGRTISLAADHRASRIGDTVTVVIVQSAEASSTVRSGTRRNSALTGRLGVGSISEGADASLGSTFDGQGQTSRSERFVTQMTAKVSQVQPNGDLEITGNQRLQINGETTTIEVRGVVRDIDIDSNNRVPSNRIADAQINYKGKGFVSRSGKPGLLSMLFTLFGLL
ncbi:MAG: flagellar basal body L-ring protein FlgH [Novosphingobium sp.]|uniref:flagellar basal body L-ring protein FlgH n=1 Tax=Novosphingobium sp. TaxID=1874826 RepID=UPI0032B863B9